MVPPRRGRHRGRIRAGSQGSARSRACARPRCRRSTGRARNGRRRACPTRPSAAGRQAAETPRGSGPARRCARTRRAKRRARRGRRRTARRRGSGRTGKDAVDEVLITPDVMVGLLFAGDDMGVQARNPIVIEPPVAPIDAYLETVVGPRRAAWPEARGRSRGP